MALTWTPEDRATIELGIARHPVASGRCAALARVVFGVAKPRDERARGLHVKPLARSRARYVVPRLPHPPRWASHTLVETLAHRVDGLTGADGCPADAYLDTHWQDPRFLEVVEVDVFAIDPGIEDLA